MAWQMKTGLAAVAVATVFAGWSGWSWLSASQDESLTYAQLRDDALQAGREHIAQLSTLDYHDTHAGVTRWLDVSTGTLREQLQHTDENALAATATVSTGKVLDAAVSDLNAHAGTAKLLASVEITVAKNGVAPGTKRNRFTAQLTKTDGGWKLSALDQIPVGAR
ncbi:hypothetical protein AB5J62_31960 [Amycolatopsis sp. cg5]|uniref:hypothetical protein n=1 Tax=Amycolatopsis sp. cg5 TaxID=3238802 RepID=UPI00352582B6